MRILSQDGNVIAADFRTRPLQVTISATAETLYTDDLVTLTRITYRVNGAPSAIQHVMTDLTIKDET